MRDREMTRSVGGGSARRANDSAAVGPAGTGARAGIVAMPVAVRTWLSSESAGRGGAVGSGLPGRGGEAHSQPLGSPGLAALPWDTQQGRGASPVEGRVPQQGHRAAGSAFDAISPAAGAVGQAHARPGGSQAASSVATAVAKRVTRQRL